MEKAGDVIVGQYVSSPAEDRCLGWHAPITLVHGEAQEGQPVPYFGAYCQAPTRSEFPKSFQAYEPKSCPIGKEACLSMASLGDVQSVEVFYDRDNRYVFAWIPYLEKVVGSFTTYKLTGEQILTHTESKDGTKSKTLQPVAHEVFILRKLAQMFGLDSQRRWNAGIGRPWEWETLAVRRASDAQDQRWESTMVTSLSCQDDGRVAFAGLGDALLVSSRSFGGLM
ncbi:hypothetical protein CIB48_g4021 [Xylaria polymorpha]|nr:hypothetical protein CIB48_g4021 [Xylaria polymorpha]